MMGTRIPVILIGLLMGVIGLLFLLPMIGMGSMLPIDLTTIISLPSDIAGIPMLYLMAGITGLGFLLLIIGVVNPNYMLQ
jgi:hypothetical protein